MKFKDLMLDLATGDASPYDAYIEEAIGKINVSAAIYDANAKIMEAAEQQIRSDVIIEAAEECGLPVTYQEAEANCCRACKEVTKAIPALCITIAKKLQSQCGARAKGFKAVVKGIGNKVIPNGKHIITVKEADAFADSYKDAMDTIGSAFAKSSNLKGLTKGLVKATKLVKVAPVGASDVAFTGKTANKMSEILASICAEAEKAQGMFGDIGRIDGICEGSTQDEQNALMDAGKQLAEALKGLQTSIGSQFGDTLSAVGTELSEK